LLERRGSIRALCRRYALETDATDAVLRARAAQAARDWARSGEKWDWYFALEVATRNEEPSVAATRLLSQLELVAEDRGRREVVLEAMRSIEDPRVYAHVLPRGTSISVRETLARLREHLRSWFGQWQIERAHALSPAEIAGALASACVDAAESRPIRLAAFETLLRVDPDRASSLATKYADDPALQAATRPLLVAGADLARRLRACGLPIRECDEDHLRSTRSPAAAARRPKRKWIPTTYACSPSRVRQRSLREPRRGTTRCSRTRVWTFR
jgi:hypothetical protein